MKLQEIENFLKIDLQMFGEGDGDTPVPTPPLPPLPTPPEDNTPTPEDDDDEDEDEDVALLKKRLKVMDGERALELNKVATLESELSETKKMMVEMQNLLLKRQCLLVELEMQPKRQENWCSEKIFGKGKVSVDYRIGCGLNLNIDRIKSIIKHK